jgi:N-acylglucosamine 2-epimerase
MFLQVNPGHAIECAWFMLDYARHEGDKALEKAALEALDMSYEGGWDAEHGGGIIYFKDIEGYNPSELLCQL